MRLLKEIYRTAGICIEGKAVTRHAVRGIILNQRELLMIHSQNDGDYKFPGGGVKDGESHQKALRREVQEESGAKVKKIEAGFGKVIEYDLPVEADYEVFKMTSHYYICQIEDCLGEQALDTYEAALGFVPCWVSVDEALRTNRALLQHHRSQVPKWTEREAFVLTQVKEKLCK